MLTLKKKKRRRTKNKQTDHRGLHFFWVMSQLPTIFTKPERTGGKNNGIKVKKILYF